jgi:hypothetical protein
VIERAVKRNEKGLKESCRAESIAAGVRAVDAKVAVVAMLSLSAMRSPL